MKQLALTSNKLKIIAFIAMILDHIGYYFEFALPSEVYLVLRIVGRIAMPLFIFLIVQGYFHTKDIKKYVLRLFTLAIVTQLCVVALTCINKLCVPTYHCQIAYDLNIVFSFTLVLLFIFCLDTLWINKKQILFKILTMLAILIIYCFIPIDYDFEILLLACIFYLLHFIETPILKRIVMVLSIVLLSLIVGKLQFFMILSIVFLVCYNDQYGKKSKLIQTMWYYLFPIQHTCLYALAMLCFVMKST